MSELTNLEKRLLKLMAEYCISGDAGLWHKIKELKEIIEKLEKRGE
jgi:hypothetical protein